MNIDVIGHHKFDQPLCGQAVQDVLREHGHWLNQLNWMKPRQSERRGDHLSDPGTNHRLLWFGGYRRCTGSSTQYKSVDQNPLMTPDPCSSICITWLLPLVPLALDSWKEQNCPHSTTKTESTQPKSVHILNTITCYIVCAKCVLNSTHTSTLNSKGLRFWHTALFTPHWALTTSEL